MGGEVPKHYYSPKPSVEFTSNMKSVMVGPKSSEKIEVNVPGRNRILR